MVKLYSQLSPLVACRKGHPNRADPDQTAFKEAV